MDDILYKIGLNYRETRIMMQYTETTLNKTKMYFEDLKKIDFDVLSKYRDCGENTIKSIKNKILVFINSESENYSPNKQISKYKNYKKWITLELIDKEIKDLESKKLALKNLKKLYLKRKL